MSDMYAGECSADCGASLSLDRLTHCCNPGYARTRCANAATAEADSHRFLVISDTGGSIEIAWASERDHHPIAVGKLRFKHEPEVASGPLEHQARACAQAYLHRTGRV
jgi:hypothetical protein